MANKVIDKLQTLDDHYVVYFTTYLFRIAEGVLTDTSTGPSDNIYRAELFQELGITRLGEIGILANVQEGQSFSNSPIYEVDFCSDRRFI